MREPQGAFRLNSADLSLLQDKSRGQPLRESTESASTPSGDTPPDGATVVNLVADGRSEETAVPASSGSEPGSPRPSVGEVGILSSPSPSRLLTTRFV